MTLTPDLALLEGPASDISVRQVWEWRLRRDDGAVLLSFAPTEQEAYDAANAAKLASPV